MHTRAKGWIVSLIILLPIACAKSDKSNGHDVERKATEAAQLPATAEPDVPEPPPLPEGIEIIWSTTRLVLPPFPIEAHLTGEPQAGDPNADPDGPLNVVEVSGEEILQTEIAPDGRMVDMETHPYGAIVITGSLEAMRVTLNAGSDAETLISIRNGWMYISQELAEGRRETWVRGTPLNLDERSQLILAFKPFGRTTLNPLYMRLYETERPRDGLVGLGIGEMRAGRMELGSSGGRVRYEFFGSFSRLP